MADYVKLRTHVTGHVRFLEAGSVARDLYVWGMAWSGHQETDGVIPMAALLASPWGAGGKRNVVIAQKLVEVGLWVRTDAGFAICKWAEQGNVTKADLVEKRDVWRKKKAAAREKRAAVETPPKPDTLDSVDESGVCPRGTPRGIPAGIPTSTSTSDLGSLGGTGGSTPPEWFGAALETVENQTGEKLRPPDSWLRYSGHRAGKGIAAGQQDAVYWLATVMVPEARKERRAESDKRDRDAKFDAERAARPSKFTPADTPPAPYHRPARVPREERSDPKHASAAMAEMLAALNTTKREAS